jgi:hypothetical protein
VLLVYQQPLFAGRIISGCGHRPNQAFTLSRPAAAAALVAHKRMRRRRLGNYLIANALSGGSSCIVLVLVISQTNDVVLATAVALSESF